MTRPHLEWLQSSEIVAKPIANGPLPGLTQRTLSVDDQTGASTSLIYTTGGWSGKLGSLSGYVEIFITQGKVNIDTTPLGRLGYISLAETTSTEIAAETEFLLMVDPTRLDDKPSSAIIVDGENIEWEKELHGAPAGVGVKVLRGPDERGPVTLLVGNVPHYDSGPEFHECPEEIFILEGDVGNATTKVGPGDYLWRPEYVTHGPYRSNSGLLVFLRGHGEIVAHWIDNPESTPEQNREYALNLHKKQ